MSTSDFIATLSLLISLSSFLIAFLAYKESKKTNRLALHLSRSEIYDALHALVLDSLCQGIYLNEASVIAFERHASEAKKILPSPLDQEIEDFYSDCQFLVQAQSFSKPIDPFLSEKIATTAVRVNRTALQIDNKFLKFIRSAAAA